MCGSKRPAATTTTTAPPPEVMEAYRRVMARAEPLADTPYQEYGGERVAGFTPDQLAAFQGVRDAQGAFQPYLDQATGYATLGASPIDEASIARYQNPFQQQVIDATMADFGTQNARQLSEVRGNAAARGALGGNRVAVAESLAQEQQNRTQAPIIANLRSQGWNSALNAAQADRAAAGQGAYTFGSLGGQALSSSLTGANALFGMGGQQQALDQAGLNVPYQYFQEGRAYPFQTTSWLSQIATGLGSNMGGTSTSTSPAPSPLNAIIGAAGTAAGAYMMSDERAKDNVIPIGEMFDGTPIYRFNYKGSDKTEVGVMAQDVERRDPDAVARGPGGLRMVNYDRATAPSAMQGEFARGGAVDEIPGSGFMSILRGYDDGNPMLGGLLGNMGDEGQIANSLFGMGLGGLAYKAIKGKAEGGAVGMPGIATGNSVMPYSGGFIPVLPMGRGAGIPRGAPAAAPRSDDAAGNALQNLASMYRRRPGAAPETLTGWETTVTPSDVTLGEPMGFDSGGVVDDFQFQPSPMSMVGSQDLGQPMMLPRGDSAMAHPAVIMGADAVADEGSRDGEGGRFPGVSPVPPEFRGPLVNQQPMNAFTGMANPTGAPITIASLAHPVQPPAQPSMGVVARPNPSGAPLAMVNPTSQRGLGANVSRGTPTGGGGESPPPAATSQAPADSGMRNIGLALMMAGLRTMASPSPYLGVAIGEGGQTGVQTYMQQEEAQHRRRLSQEQVNLQARRLEEQARHNRAGEGAGRYQFLSLGPGQGTLRANSRTGEFDTIPVELAPRGGAGATANRTALWQTRRDAWLAAHPNDTDGALRYAAGHRDTSLTPQRSQQIALQMAQRDAQADLGLSGDRRQQYIQNRAAEYYQMLQTPGQAAPNPAPAQQPQRPSSGGSWWNPLSWGGGSGTPPPQPGAAPAAAAPAAAPAAQATPPLPPALATDAGNGRWGWSPSLQRWVNNVTREQRDRSGNPVQ